MDDSCWNSSTGTWQNEGHDSVSLWHHGRTSSFNNLGGGQARHFPTEYTSHCPEYSSPPSRQQRGASSQLCTRGCLPALALNADPPAGSHTTHRGHPLYLRHTINDLGANVACMPPALGQLRCAADTPSAHGPTRAGENHGGCSWEPKPHWSASLSSQQLLHMQLLQAHRCQMEEQALSAARTPPVGVRSPFEGAPATPTPPTPVPLTAALRHHAIGAPPTQPPSGAVRQPPAPAPLSAFTKAAAAAAAPPSPALLEPATSLTSLLAYPASEAAATMLESGQMHMQPARSNTLRVLEGLFAEAEGFLDGIMASSSISASEGTQYGVDSASGELALGPPRLSSGDSLLHELGLGRNHSLQLMMCDLSGIDSAAAAAASSDTTCTHTAAAALEVATPFPHPLHSTATPRSSTPGMLSGGFGADGSGTASGAAARAAQAATAGAATPSRQHGGAAFHNFDACARTSGGGFPTSTLRPSTTYSLCRATEALCAGRLVGADGAPSTLRCGAATVTVNAIASASATATAITAANANANATATASSKGGAAAAGKKMRGKGKRPPRRRALQHVRANPRRTACYNCGTHQTPQWRCGPEGPRTLCNACGVRYKKGMTLPYLEHKAAVAAAAAMAAAEEEAMLTVEAAMADT